MAFQVMMAEDYVCILSPLLQTAWGTRLPDVDFEAGHRVLLNAATIGDVRTARAGVGPRPGGQTEHSIASNKRTVGHESSLSILMDAEVMYVGAILAQIQHNCTSTQEGATTRYTHVMKCSGPLDVDEDYPGRDCFLTGAFIDSGGPDVTRLMRLFADLIPQSLTLSGRGKDLVQMAVDFAGSGLVYDQDSNPAVAITVPAVTAVVKLGNDGLKFEYGDKGGSLTDISERVDQWSLRFDQQLCGADKRYYPGSGLYAKRAWFVRRRYSIELGLFVDRASKDLIADMVAMTQKELKVTMDSGVACGTGTGNQKLVVRYPDIQITESPINFDAEGAAYAVRVDPDDVNEDTTVGDAPCTVTLDNIQTAYLVQT